MQVTLHYAEEHFADLLEAVNGGEEVEILQSATKPSIKLALIFPPVPELTGDRILGMGQGRMRVPSFEEWKGMDREIATLMNDGPMLALEKR